MRLLNTNTLQLFEFFDSSVPEYAILSHTWREEEVSYQEWMTQATNEALRRKKGYWKISKFCQLCREQGYAWTWIDTCCIDKSSSAELSEAINSMYQWYKDARLCYVYLVDVPALDDIESEGSKFSQSRWFSRGWTLQELIAPESVHFYSKDWVKLGERVGISRVLEKITGIEYRLLLRPVTIHDYSIARKMSWASKRTTSRKEDMAYCLLGIFDVNMPLLYGEGDKAFLRLQEEIIKVSTDHTLFAWTIPEKNMQVNCGLLAPSPSFFVNASHIMRQPTAVGKSAATLMKTLYSHEPYSMTNRGLRIELALVRSWAFSAHVLDAGNLAPETENQRVAILNCISAQAPGKIIAVHLEPIGIDVTGGDYGAETYQRTKCDKLEYLDHDLATQCKFESIYLQRESTIVHRVPVAMHFKGRVVDVFAAFAEAMKGTS